MTKVKLKKQQADKSVIIGSPEWDGSVTINGTTFETGQTYEVEPDFYETHSAIFSKVKGKNKNE